MISRNRIAKSLSAPIPQQALFLAAPVPLLLSVALVMELFALGKGDIEFHQPPVIKQQLERHDGKAPALHRPGERGNLPFGQ